MERCGPGGGGDPWDTLDLEVTALRFVPPAGAGSQGRQTAQVPSLPTLALPCMHLSLSLPLTNLLSRGCLPTSTASSGPGAPERRAPMATPTRGTKTGITQRELRGEVV